MAHNRSKPSEGGNNQSQPPFAAADYLPGGDRYKNFQESNVSGNPRGDKPIPQWLREWEKKWQDIGDKKDIRGQYLLFSLVLHP